MGSVFQDLRYAARSLTRTPAFTAVAVLVLALGIGANTAIFGVVDATLLKPMPYPESDRVVRISASHPQAFVWFNPRGFELWPAFRRTRALSAVGAYEIGGANLGGDPGQRIRATAVTAEFFDVLGAKAMLGRVFTADDVRLSQHITVISHWLWQNRFGGSRDILEKSILLNGQSFLVLGVMPLRADVPHATDVWIPNGRSIQINEDIPRPVVIARLALDATVKQALEEVMRTPSPRFDRGRVLDSDFLGWLGTRVTPLREALAGDAKPILLLIAAAALLVLLVACINTASLLLTRMSARQREFAVRRALGASNIDLARQVLSESLLLSLAAGILTLPIASWALDAVRAFVPITLYGAAEIAVNHRAVIATAGFSVITAGFFSIAPLWSLRNRSSADALRDALVATVDPRWRRFRSSLVIVEIAIALVLLVGAVTVVRTVAALMAVDLGARGERALVIQLDLPQARYKAAERSRQFYDQLEASLRAIPGVQDVAVTSGLPGAANRSDSAELLIDGEPTPAGRNYLGAHISASPRYFSALGIDLIAGRVFTSSDHFFAPKVAIVSETFARNLKLGPNEIVGRTAILDHRRVQIVGVARDVRLGGPESAFDPVAYTPFAQRTITGPMHIVVKAERDPRQLVPAIRAAGTRVDPNVPLYNIRTFDEIRETYIKDRRFVMTMMSAFAGLAFALAALGLYGIISYLVQLRTREIGIRMALGASISSVHMNILRSGVALALAGIVLGGAVAVGLSRLLSSTFRNFGQVDLLSLLLLSVAVVVVSAIAAWFPARRATLIDPVKALRFE